jgi:membrane fusion protein (multidrug efflux system)
MSSLVETAPSLSGSADGAAQPKSKAASASRRVQLALVLVLALAGGGGYAYTQRGLVSTDNAQIDAEVIAVPARTGGTIAALHFVENHQVKQGDLLATIDDAPARARLAQAEANLEAAQAAAEAAEADARVATSNAQGNKALAIASLRTTHAGANAASVQVREAMAAVSAAEAQLAQAEDDAARATELFGTGATSRSAFDQSKTQLSLARANLDAARARITTLESARGQAESRVGEASARVQQTRDVDSVMSQALARAKAAKAQVHTAQAARDLAALELSYTRIVAPHDGVVSKKSIAVGQQVTMGQPVVQLVTPERWVTANFKETQLANLRPGQPVEIEVDAFPGQKLHGTVESLSGATGSRFTLLPPDNASGNFTKVVQRVPVRIRVSEAPRDRVLAPGMSVELTVNTRS